MLNIKIYLIDRCELMTNELTLSKSKINTFIECPRKFKYRYIDEITEETNKYMLLGKKFMK